MGISTSIGSGSFNTNGLSWLRMTASHTALAAGSLNYDVSTGGNCREGAHFRINLSFFAASVNFRTIPM